MKAWATTFLKLCWGTYFILASLYCFLAFTPFTYLFVIVYPPYRWIGTFAHYNVLLLWIAVAASVLSEWLRSSNGMPRVMTVAELSLAVIISIQNPISHAQNNVTALAWSVGFLLPLLITAAYDLSQRASASCEQNRYSSIAYSDAIFIGFLAGLIPIAALRLYTAMYLGTLLVQRHDVELMFWVVVEHLTLAISVASVINLIRSLLFRRTKNAFILGSGVVGLVVFIGLGFGCLCFIEDSLSLRGWAAWGYSSLLAATITLCSLALLVPIFSSKKQGRMNRWLPATSAILLIAVAIYVPLAIDQGGDWNGILHQTFAVLLWVALAISICRLRSLQKQYSIGTVLAVALVTCGVYETLNYSKSLWAADVGANKMLILRELLNLA